MNAQDLDASEVTTSIKKKSRKSSKKTLSDNEMLLSINLTTKLERRRRIEDLGEERRLREESGFGLAI